MRIILTYTLTNYSLRIVDPYPIANFEIRQLVQYREQFSVGTLDFRRWLSGDSPALVRRRVVAFPEQYRDTAVGPGFRPYAP